MLMQERRESIVELVNSQGQCAVEYLAKKFSVTPMTIRRDLQSLEEQGVIRRIHGGAMRLKLRWNILEPPWMERLDYCAIEKNRIGSYVASLIGPTEKVFIGTGSTTYYVAEALTERQDLSPEFIVITNAITISNILAKHSTINCLVIGGFIRHSELSLVGHYAQSILDSLHVDKVIMGIRGIHPEHGLTSDYPEDLKLDQSITKLGDQVYVVADHTKLGYVSASLTAPVTDMDMLITDEQADKEIVRFLKNKGVQVVLV